MPRRIAVIVLVLGLIAAGVWFFSRAKQQPPAPAAPPHAVAASPAPRSASPLRLSPGTALPIASDGDASACVVEGRVVSTRSGAGAAHAQLTFSRGGAVFAVNGADDGSFRWTAAEPGTYQLTSAAAPGFLAFAPELGHSPVQLRAQRGVRLSGITIFLTPAVEYTGLVVDDKRKPLAGAQVRRVEPLDGEPSEFTTNQDGELTFHSPDDASFEASHAGYKPRVQQLDLAAQVSRRLTFQLTPQDGSEPSPRPIAGKVTDGSGAPIDNALVTAYERDGLVARAISESDGRFSLSVRSPRVHLVATSPGWVPAEIEAAAGDTEVTLQLKKGGRISGTVREKESGRAVIAFSVLATRKKGALESGETVTGSFFDPDGGYRLEGLRAGTYLVVAVAQGRAASAPVEVAVSDGADGRADFTLSRGARLSGRVIDGVSREGIARARVSLENPFGASTDLPLPVVASAETNPSGDFALDGLSEGSCSLFTAAEGHHSRMMPGIQIRAEGTPPLTIDLTPTQPGEEPLIESAGINAQVRAQGDQMILGRISVNGGAAAAGLQEGDIILRVDGADVRELGFAGAIQKLRGPEGSVVVVGIRRGDNEMDVVVTRRRVINR
jgi:hypothetical protein